MKLKEFKILKVILPFFIPYIILYALYIQINGEISPGGGFQAGVIFASGFIAYDLIFGCNAFFSHIKPGGMLIAGAFGVFLYAATGLVSFVFDANYLDYSVLASTQTGGQHLGIIIIELGVGITVSAIMCLIYMVLRDETKE